MAAGSPNEHLPRQDAKGKMLAGELSDVPCFATQLDAGTLYIGADDLTVKAITPPIGGAGATIKWSYRTGCMVHSAPAIGPDGTVYVAGLGWDLFAFNPKANSSGEALKWRWHQDDSGLTSSPAVGADGTIYVSGSGNLYAISPPASGDKGVLKWAFPLEAKPLSSPAIGADGTVYVTAGKSLYAVR